MSKKARAYKFCTKETDLKCRISIHIWSTALLHSTLSLRYWKVWFQKIHMIFILFPA